jgi:beta-phosphoglucomutase-like phosphatase (HAD superfamily)
MIIKDINSIDSILKNKDTYILDFDGTIANTEKYQWEAYNKCLERYNVKLTDSDILRYIGNKESIIYKMIKEDFNIYFDDKDFFEKRIIIYLELIKQNKLEPYQYFKDLISNYNNKVFCILSSNKKFIIEEILEYWNIKDSFYKIISVSDMQIDKSNVMSNTLEYFGCKQNDAILFEDTNIYLKMAKEYKILAIGVETNYNKKVLKDYDIIIQDAIDD